nr:ribonuclease H-like domain, reverse transcriptase, RNA-dependent DNA polymerase [Tanacetum cinerariifolium]
MGELTFFLRLQVKQKEDGIFTSQDKYVAEILKKFDFLSVKTASTPIETQKPLVKDEEGADVDVHLFSKELASPKQTALGKDISNLLMAGRLPKTTLPTSSVGYALTASSTIRTSYIKQFWTTAKVKTINNEVRIQNLIDEKWINIKESSICRILKLDDAEGTSCLANAEIFDGLAKMGYEKLSKSLPSSRLSSHLNGKVQLLKLGDMSYHKNIYDNPSLTKKVFANMKRVGTGFSGIVTPLFDNMLVPAAKEVGLIQDDVQSITIPTEPSTSKPYKKHKSKKQQTQAPKVPSPKPSPSNDPLPGGKDSLKLKELMIEKLEGRVDMLEEERRVSKDLHSVHSKVDIVVPVMEKERSFKQGRITADIDEDVEINLEEAQAKLYRIDLEHPEKVLSMQDVDDEEPAEVEEILEVVKAAKLITEVVTTAGATTTSEATKISVPRRRRGVVIQDPEETTSIIVVHSEIEQDEACARKLEVKLNADTNWNAVMKQVKREGHKREGESLKNEITKKQKMDEEAKELKSHLQIVSNDDDDVYTEATPLASKIPIVDYKIHFERNKPYDNQRSGNHMLFLSFSTLLKNFDKEDLESLWKLVKERFEKTEPKNYSDDYLPKTLKTMFEQLDVEASVWRDQKGRYRFAKKYPLTHFTPEQMLNNVRLKVEEESETYLELLRLVIRQLNEG